MSGHTPGPWFACCDDENAYSHFVFQSESEACICSMDSNDPDDPRDKYEKLEPVVTVAERQANARLIAAAPDLLEALKASYAVTKDALDDLRGLGAEDSILAIRLANSERVIRSAIAKAEGKS